MLAVIALAVLAGAGYRLEVQWRSAGPASANQAIHTAASSSAALMSADATFSTQVSGLTQVFGTVREQRSPHELARLTMTAVNGAERFAVTEVVTSSYVYVFMPSLADAFGRPWLGVPVADLSADPAMAELYQTQVIPSAEAGLLGCVTNARRAGNGVVGGVPTTRYIGTVDPATALGKLSRTVRRLLAPELTVTTGPIRVTVWVRSQQDIRKIVTSAMVGGQLTVTTVEFTAAGPGARIRVPAATRVAGMLPGGPATS